MLKKGTFLAEIAVVLFVMGILISVTLRTRSFLDAAEYRAEATKFIGIQQAWHNYYNLRVAIPPLLNNSPDARAYDLVVFMQSGLLEKDEFYSNYRVGNDYPFYGYSQCYSEDNVTTDQYMKFNRNDPDVCITIFNTDNPLQITGRPSTITAKLLCNLENIIDDNDAMKGNMLITEGSFPIVSYKGCKAAENAGILSGTYKFGYKIDRSY